MIYLASPYTHSLTAVRNRRYWTACCAVADLLRSGHAVFSPIVLGHPLVEQHGPPTEWPWRERFDREHIERSDEVVVLTLDGWERSAGVAAEVRIAEDSGKPVRYLEPSGEKEFAL